MKFNFSIFIIPHDILNLIYVVKNFKNIGPYNKVYVTMKLDVTLFLSYTLNNK